MIKDVVGSVDWRESKGTMVGVSQFTQFSKEK